MPLYVKSPISGKYFPADLCYKYGTKTLFPKDFLPYEEAKKFFKEIGIKNIKEWALYCKSGKRPNNIPSNPSSAYKDKGWISWNDFFDIEINNKHNKTKNFLSYEEAKKFVRKLRLKSKQKWIKYSESGKKPKNIPSIPSKIYKDNGWINWGDFLGTKNQYGKKDFLSYIEAKIIVRKLGLKTQKEWSEYAKSDKRPYNVPYSPYNIYKDKGWINWGDFLGATYIYKKKDFLPYEEAKKVTQNLNIKTDRDWRKYNKSGRRPKNIPSDPYTTYKDKGWISWGDFLGTKNISCKNREFVSYEEAKKFFKGIGIKSENEWRAYCKSGKKPNNIPSDPSKIYKIKGWTNWPDFLGTK